MGKRLKQLGLALINLLVMGYPLALVLLRIARVMWGDRFWWLAIANSFAPWLFVLAPLSILLALIARRRSWVLAIACVPTLMFAALYGSRLLHTTPSVLPDEPTLRVMAFNAYGFNMDVEKPIRMIRDEVPDVIAFQELNLELAAALQSQLIDEYPYQALYAQVGVLGRGVVSKHPMLDDGLLDLPGWERRLQQVRIEWQGQEVTLINVHPYPPVLAGNNIGERLDRFEEVTRLQQEQIQDLLSYTTKIRTPLLIMGDFNSGDESVTYSLMSNVYEDAYAQAGAGLGHTFPAPGDGERSGLPLGLRFTLRLDYVYHSKHFRAIAAHVAEWDGGSDHFAVVATLALGEE